MTVQSGSDLASMRAVGKLVARALDEMRAAARPGMTTEQLDDIGAKFLRRARRALGAAAHVRFPGLQLHQRERRSGARRSGRARAAGRRRVKIDVTAELDGYIADSAITVVIPPVVDAREQPRAVRAKRRSSAR